MVSNTPLTSSRMPQNIIGLKEKSSLLFIPPRSPSVGLHFYEILKDRHI